MSANDIDLDNSLNEVIEADTAEAAETNDSTKATVDSEEDQSNISQDITFSEEDSVATPVNEQSEDNTNQNDTNISEITNGIPNHTESDPNSPNSDKKSEKGVFEDSVFTNTGCLNKACVLLYHDKKKTNDTNPFTCSNDNDEPNDSVKEVSSDCGETECDHKKKPTFDDLEVDDVWAEDMSWAKCCSSVNGSAGVRDNKTSLRRKQLSHMRHEKSGEDGQGDEEYVTPFQRKDRIIKELKKELKESQALLKKKDEEVNTILETKEGECWDLLKVKEIENQELRKELDELKQDSSFLKISQEETAESLRITEKMLKELKLDMSRKEEKHQDMYFKMYQKGKESAVIERDAELNELLCCHPEQMRTADLLDKLQHTEKELHKWQTLKRQQSYEEGERPQTEDEATLKFLKNSMYHYLMETDEQLRHQHLRVMVRILRFTDDQLNHISKRGKKSRSSSSEYYGAFN